MKSETQFTETERKFLVSDGYRQEAVSSSHIVQGYLCSDSKRTIRIRIRDDKGYITIKGKCAPGELSRFEWEKEIPASEAAELLKLADPGIIDKERFLVPNTDGKHIWEIDEFHGENEGLRFAEIELSDQDEAFDKPAWLGDEVSFDRRFYNSYLTTHPFRRWSAEEKDIIL